MKSYHYRSLLVILALAACSNDERTTPAHEPAVVPSLVGRTVADAVGAVQGAGLSAAFNNTTPAVPLDECGTGTVTAQDEPPGTELVRGSQVILTVACVTASPPP